MATPPICSRVAPGVDFVVVSVVTSRQGRAGHRADGRNRSLRGDPGDERGVPARSSDCGGSPMKKWLFVALLLVGATILGATVLREPIGYAASPFTNVIIGNDATHPVPVTSAPPP